MADYSMYSSGLAGYLSQEDRTAAANSRNLNDSVTRHSLLSKMQSQQEDEQIKQVLSTSNSPEDAIQKLKAFGEKGMKLSDQISKSQQQQQQTAMSKQFSGMGQMNTDQLDLLGQNLAINQHPGAATVMNIADKRRKLEQDKTAMSAMQSSAGQPAQVAGTMPPPELGGGPPTPDTPGIPAQPGVTDYLQNSPHVGGAAKSLQGMINSNAISPQMAQQQLDRLTQMHVNAASQAQRNNYMYPPPMGQQPSSTQQPAPNVADTSNIQPASAGGDMSGSPSPMALLQRISDPAERARATAAYARQNSPIPVAAATAQPTIADAPPGLSPMNAQKWLMDQTRSSPIRLSAVPDPNDPTKAIWGRQQEGAPAFAPGSGGILNNQTIRERQIGNNLTATIKPHTAVMDSYQRFNDIKTTGDNSQANQFLAMQLMQMSKTGQRALPDKEIQRILGSGELGGSLAGRFQEFLSQAATGVRSPEIDKRMNDLADAMARSSASRIGQEMQNARASTPIGANPDNITGSKPRIYGRFIITPTGNVHTFASAAEAQAKLNEAAQKLGQ